MNEKLLYDEIRMFMEPVHADCLIKAADLESRIRRAIGSSFSLDIKYQPKIKEGANELTSIWDFVLVHYAPYIEAVNSGRYVNRLTGFLESQTNPDHFERLTAAKNKLEALYRREGKNLDEVINHDYKKRVTETEKTLKDILQHRGLQIKRILNPENVHTEGLFVFVNDGETALLVVHYSFIEGLKSHNLKYSYLDSREFDCH